MGKLEQLKKTSKVDTKTDAGSDLMEKAAVRTVSEEKKEAKSSQYVAMLRPTTKANVKKIAKVLNKGREKKDYTSLNDIVNELLDQYVADHQKELRIYEEEKGAFDE